MRVIADTHRVAHQLDRPDNARFTDRDLALHRADRIDAHRATVNARPAWTERLLLLLEFSQGLPPLPARYAEHRDLLEPGMRKILFLGIVLAVFQQWCGINVIFNYAEEVFAAAGYKVSDLLLNIVITGAVNLVFTIVAIGVVDKVGRRKLMLMGSAGLAITCTVLGTGYYEQSHGIYMLILVVAAIACYSMSLAPVTWVVISEIFPNRIRGTAMSVAVMSLWASSFILTYTFPLVDHGLGAAVTFWIYAGICVAGFVFIMRRLPETKGKTLEEIEQSWKN